MEVGNDTGIQPDYLRKKGNKKRSGVRSVFCYDIGIIGDTVLHRGVRRTVRGCYMPLSEHDLSIRPDCVRCVKYG